MIVKLKGFIEEIHENSIYVNVSGVCYEVFVIDNDFKEFEQTDFYIKQIISETSNELYGFKSLEEKSFFEHLLSFRGLGGKTLISILSKNSIDFIANCLNDENIDELAKLPRIGKKTAERIVTEYKHSIKKFDIKSAKDKNMGNVISQAEDCLSTIGYKKSDIKNILNDKYEKGINVSDLVNKVIKNI